MTSKQALRQSIKKLTSSLSQAELKGQSHRTAVALRAHPLYSTSKRIGFYMHMGYGELQTEEMISNAFEDGKQVFLPHIVKYTEREPHPWFPGQTVHLQMLELPSFQAVLELEPRGKLQLKEPTSGNNCLSSGLDLLILPGVGFTTNGKRLGHGAGFYDSFISEYESVFRRIPKLLGVGLQQQIVEPSESLPTSEHDRMLDCVILNGKVHNC